MDTGLTVVGTPIGNLGDLSPRAADALVAADLVACEDTRRTAPLLRHVGSSAPMLAVHSHNEAARTAELIRRIGAGERVALVSDAGMPLVSDPGGRLVWAAARAGIVVDVVPGPSAPSAAVALAGLGEGGGYLFVGFAPRRPTERARLVAELAQLTRPAVAFESPQRVAGLLATIAEALPDRPVVVCRELTKLHQQVWRGSAAEVAAQITGPLRGEVTLVVGPAPATPEGEGGGDDAALRAGLGLMLEAGMGARRASEAVAALGVAPRNRAYRLALELSEANRTAK